MAIIYKTKNFTVEAPEKPDFYSRLKPLKQEDQEEMEKEIKKILKEEKFSDLKWGL